VRDTLFNGRPASIPDARRLAHIEEDPPAGRTAEGRLNTSAVQSAGAWILESWTISKSNTEQVWRIVDVRDEADRYGCGGGGVRRRGGYRKVSGPSARPQPASQSNLARSLLPVGGNRASQPCASSQQFRGIGGTTIIPQHPARAPSAPEEPSPEVVKLIGQAGFPVLR